MSVVKKVTVIKRTTVRKWWKGRVILRVVKKGTARK